MKRFYAMLMALAVLALVALATFAPVVVAQDGGGEPPPTIDVTAMIIMAATSLGGFLVGLAIKNWPALEGYSNRLIPYTILLLTTVGFAWLRDLPLKEAILQAGAATLGSVLIYEGVTKKKPKVPS